MAGRGAPGSVSGTGLRGLSLHTLLILTLRAAARGLVFLLRLLLFVPLLLLAVGLAFALRLRVAAAAAAAVVAAVRRV